MALPNARSGREYGKFIETANGDIAVRNLSESADLSTYQSQSAEASKVVLDGSGYLKSLTVLIDNQAATDLYYVHIVDADAVPDDGAVTLVAPPVEINHTLNTQSSVVIDFSKPGKKVTNGITVYISTTQVAKTIAGAVGLFFAEYRAL